MEYEGVRAIPFFRGILVALGKEHHDEQFAIV